MFAPHEVTMRISEDLLVARCQAGDLDAFGQVYARYERLVFRYAYHMLGHRDDATDVKQETFIKAYVALKGFRGDCSLQTWLFKICGNLCRDRMKRRDRRSEMLCPPEEAEEHARDRVEAVDPITVMERTETAAIIHGALRGLPAAQREIIVLRDIEDLSCDEIAEILGCSRAYVGVKLFRARQRLKERVKSLMEARG